MSDKQLHDERCRHYYLGPSIHIGPQCCLPAGHDGPHLYKCADPHCPGYPVPASVEPHMGCDR